MIIGPHQHICINIVGYDYGRGTKITVKIIWIWACAKLESRKIQILPFLALIDHVSVYRNHNTIIKSSKFDKKFDQFDQFFSPSLALLWQCKFMQPPRSSLKYSLCRYVLAMRFWRRRTLNYNQATVNSMISLSAHGRVVGTGQVKGH